MERLETKIAVTGEAFVKGLFETIMGAGEDSLQALEELSGIAMGGNKLARGLIGQVDQAAAGGELVLPWHEAQVKDVVKKDTIKKMMPPEHPIF